jgi:hypothetical protein
MTFGIASQNTSVDDPNQSGVLSKVPVLVQRLRLKPRRVNEIDVIRNRIVLV